MRFIGIVMTVFILAGCAPARTPERDGQPSAGLDSLILERSVCFGRCPAYRLSLSGLGKIAFESRSPGTAASTAADSVAPAKVVALLSQAEATGFFTLPDTLQLDAAYCPDRATDLPTATVTIFRPTRAKTVVDYHGCNALSNPTTAAALTRLRAFEEAIDSVANTGRWSRSAVR